MYNLFKFCISVHLINCFEHSWVTHIYLVAWFFKIPSYVIYRSVSPVQGNPEFSFFGSKNTYENTHMYWGDAVGSVEGRAQIVRDVKSV